MWDEWLRQSVAASRSALGQDWLDVYLTSPVWRFACDAAVCGPHGYAGLMAPSVDRVGRYFPVTLVWQVPQGTHALSVARVANQWFDRAERLLLETLAEEQFDLDMFDQRFIAMGSELDRIGWSADVELNLDDAAGLTSGACAQWQVALGTAEAFGPMLDQLLYARLRQTHGPLSVLWTEGSSRIERSCLLLGGLPAPSSYAALLSGDWSNAGWRAVKSRMTTAPSCADTWVGERLQSYRSSGATDVGLARRTNQDAFIERTEIGVWAVADGMGGHARGEIASRMICDALASLEPGDTLQATVDMIIQQLRGINGYLSRVAVAARSGSTVVALVTRGGRCAVLWAGDSRLYRLRDGKLLQLTEDHVAEADGNDVSSHAISRAVGGDESFDIDVVYDSVRPGDRFLLCSDGLNHEIADDLIARQLMEPDGSRCVRQLIAAALRAGGKDNVSVIVVDADDPA